MTAIHLLDCLGGAVMHALWQGFVIGILVLTALRSSPNLTAGSRHAISSLGLIAFFITSIVTFGLLLAEPPPFSSGGESNTESAILSSASVAGTSPTPGGKTTTSPPSMAERTVRPVGFDSSVAFEVAPFIGWAWVLGVGLLSLRLARQWILVHRLRRDHTARPDDRWIDMFDALKRRLELDSKIAMFASRTVDSPMVIGLIRPVVLVPVSAFTSLTPDQLETILAHELLHISRRDHVLNLLQGIMEIALFFHPVTWWLSRQIRVERENCCDDDALTIAGSPRSLAEALLTLETLRTRNNNHESILAATGGSLMHRVSRLFVCKRQPLNVGWRALSACSLLTIAGLSFAAVALDAPALAQDRGTDAKTAKKVDEDDNGARNERRGSNAGMQKRLQAMGRELREQVAAGEMTEEEARRKYEAMEERIRSRSRKDGDQRMNGRRDRPAEDAELERIESDIQKRLQAMGRELREKVAAGEMSGEEAREKYETMEERMWSRYRAAESKRSESRRNGDDSSRISRAEYDAAIDRMIVMVIEGEITAEQMQSRVERMKLALDGEPNRDLEKLGANIEKRLRAMGRDLRQQVAAGDLTEEEARAKYEAAEKRMWSNHREAEERQMNDRRRADRQGSEELERMKSDMEQKLREMGGELRKQVAAGELSEDEARSKFEAMEKRMWSRYRAAEEKRMQEDVKDRRKPRR